MRMMMMRSPPRPSSQSLPTSHCQSPGSTSKIGLSFRGHSVPWQIIPEPQRRR
jgi:hypothetical protein